MNHHKDTMYPSLRQTHIELLKKLNEKIQSNQKIHFRIFDFKGIEYHLFVIAIKYKFYEFAKWYFERSIQNGHHFRYETIPFLHESQKEIKNYSTLECIIQGGYSKEKSNLLKTILPYFSDKYINFIYHLKYARLDGFYSIPFIQKLMDNGFFDVSIWLIQHYPLLRKKIMVKQSNFFGDVEYHLLYQFIYSFFFSSKEIIYNQIDIVYPFILEEIVPHIHDLGFDKNQIGNIFRFSMEESDIRVFDKLYSLYPQYMVDNHYLYIVFLNHVTMNEDLYIKYKVDILKLIPSTFSENLILNQILDIIFGCHNHMSIEDIENYLFILLSKMKNSFNLNDYFCWIDKCLEFFDDESFSYTKYFQNKELYWKYFEKIYIRSLKEILSFKIMKSLSDHDSQEEMNFIFLYYYLMHSIKEKNSIYESKVRNIFLYSFQKKYSLTLSSPVIQKILFFL